MLFSRKAIGVGISETCVNFALVGGTKSSPVLERSASRPFTPEAVRPSLRAPNVIDPQAFSSGLVEAYNMLLCSNRRLSVSLPDAAGRVLLLDMEERFKNRSEGQDIIRWKLKKQTPFEVSDTHLDYQILRVRENGSMALLVTLVSRSVIGQYEDLFVKAGFMPVKIDLDTFNLCRAFDKSLSIPGDCAMISFYGNSLSILLFLEGIPEFARFKELPGASPCDSRVCMEISNSLLACRERFPERPVNKVCCVAPPDAATDFRDMLAEITGAETMRLEAQSIVRLSNDAPTGQALLFSHTAAIGAALRSL